MEIKMEQVVERLIDKIAKLEYTNALLETQIIELRKGQKEKEGK